MLIRKSAFTANLLTRNRNFPAWGGLVFAALAADLFAAAPHDPGSPVPQAVAERSQPDKAPKPPIDGIRDNSFLIEEAYNQEPGVVQHIFTGLLSHTGDDRAFNLSFTQEWPVFSQTHQLSYTIPYGFLDSDAMENESGLGDVLLNYRYQLTLDEGDWPAFSPRISLVFPSGDEDRGFGNGVLGYQFNLPFSKTISDCAYVNFNAGVTYFPNAGFELSNGRRPHERDLVSFNLGASLIYALSDEVHLMLETAANFEQEFEEHSTTSGGRLRVKRPYTNDVVISPGIRWASNLPNDLQVVYGLAVPIGVSDDAMDYGVFFYLSIEHPFLHNPSN